MKTLQSPYIPTGNTLATGVQAKGYLVWLYDGRFAHRASRATALLAYPQKTGGLAEIEKGQTENHYAHNYAI